MQEDLAFFLKKTVSVVVSSAHDLTPLGNEKGEVVGQAQRPATVSGELTFLGNRGLRIRRTVQQQVADEYIAYTDVCAIRAISPSLQ